MNRTHVLLFVLAILPILIQAKLPNPWVPVQDPCTITYGSDCQTCLGNTLCGFCQSSRTCFQGDANGPGGFKSNCTEWIVPGGVCIEFDCKKIKSCSSCLKAEDGNGDNVCGWCLGTKKCIDGDKSGPVKSSDCKKGYIFGNTKQCKVPTPTPRTTTGRVISASSSVSVGVVAVFLQSVLIMLALLSRS